MMASPFRSTVTVQAASKDMTVLATVLAELGLTGTDAPRDALLAALIHQASAAIVGWCNREFASETLRDEFVTTGERRCIEALILSRRPVTAIAAVVADGTTLTADDTEVDPATGFLWRLDGAASRIAWAPARIAVTFTAGYVTLTSLPQDLERACIDLVKHRWFARARDATLKSREVVDVGREDYWVGGIPGQDGGMPAEISVLLEPWRELRV